MHGARCMCPCVVFFKMPLISHPNVELDELRVIRLGTPVYVLGSALWLLTFRVGPKSMDVVWERVKHWYAELGIPTQFSSLAVSSFCDPKSPRSHYPKLKGKGMEVKWLVPVLTNVWEECVPEDTSLNFRVREVFHSQCQVQAIVDEHAHELFIPPGKSVSLRRAVGNILEKHTQLALAADEDHELLFNMPYKFHALWHWAHRSQYLCPRRGACLIDEDFVGQLKHTGQACLDGTQLHAAVIKIMTKYRWGKSLVDSN